jgi:hypothetical protein
MEQYRRNVKEYTDRMSSEKIPEISQIIIQKGK